MELDVSLLLTFHQVSSVLSQSRFEEEYVYDTASGKSLCRLSSLILVHQAHQSKKTSISSISVNIDHQHPPNAVLPPSLDMTLQSTPYVPVRSICLRARKAQTFDRSVKCVALMRDKFPADGARVLPHATPCLMHRYLDTRS